MYEGYFGLIERPFSIAPDPHYLYMSARHKEATAHLSYGLSQGGCFIVLTGEVGTGKTTLCRNLLSDLPKNVDVALILNANINETELLQTVCDELKIAYSESNSQKQLLDLINQHLLAAFADNRHTVLIIDESQLLSRDVLEQIRLLTNLETTKAKLLQIILIGQPELNDLLSRNDLRQLAQRVTARYHLGALKRSEIEDYVNFRLSVAGCKQPLFSRQALNKMHSLTGGIPRKINVLADHALLAAYSKTQSLVDAKTVKQAAQDVFIDSKPADQPINSNKRWWALAGLFLMINAGAWWFFSNQGEQAQSVVNTVNSSTRAIEKVANSEVGVNDEATLPSTELNVLSQETLETEVFPQQTTEAATVPANDVDQTELSLTSPDETMNTELDSEVAQAASDVDPSNTSLTSITPSDEIEPGTVLVSDEYLDASTSSESPPVSSASEADFINSEFARVLETSADLTGRNVADRVLAELWGVELPTPMLNSTCDEVKQQGLACLEAFSWQLLAYYNRPAVMTLSHKNQFHRVVLTGINDGVATVMIGENAHNVSVTEIRQRWMRISNLFWRPSPAGGRFMQLGDKFPNIKKVRTLVNSALSSANMPSLEKDDATEYDVDMMQKIFALQTRFGITDDSKIGNETYLLMNELVNPSGDIPVLSKRVR